MVFLPKEQLNVVDSGSTAYIRYCKHIIHDIQNNLDTPTKEVYLSFYPPAKNVRFCSSYMTQNVLNGHRSFISGSSRPGEDSFWRGVTGSNWFPWLWARTRIPGDYTNSMGWNFYFDSFSDKKNLLETSGESTQPPSDMMIFYMYLACIGYTFTFNESYTYSMNQYKSEMGWPDDKKVLAIQIRRGDSVSIDGEVNEIVKGRPVYTTEQYVENADVLLQANPDLEYVYITTDSDQEIQQIRKLRPTWNILNLPIDRSKFYRYNKDDIMKYDCGLDLEKICAKQPNIIPFTTDSAFADLYFISLSHAFVSTLTMSEFSRCGWFLQMSRNECITPYINMNGQHIDLNDTLLL